VRICLDIQPAVSQRAGVGRYTLELARELAAALDPGDELTMPYFDFARRGSPAGLPGRLLRPVRWLPGRAVQKAWKTAGWPPYNWFAGKADVYHFPNFIMPPLAGPGRTVVTIHDMSFMRYPEYAEERNLRYLGARIRDTARRADAIIAVSDFSAGEIANLLRVPPERIRSVPEGIDSAFSPRAPDEQDRVLAGLGIRRPFVLTVGTIEPRKNIPFLVQVFERLDDFDGTLVIAGMPGWKCEPIFDAIRRSSRADRIRWLSYVPDPALPGLYSAAEVFAITSFYEGFGLPPLEAMSCGTPVVSSPGGSLPEVLGEGAVVLPSFDVELWAGRIRALLRDPARRAKWGEAGRRRAARYTWRATAEATMRIYRELAQ
jgi:glycosyltransferase involved in cell wall biosynthesis